MQLATIKKEHDMKVWKMFNDKTYMKVVPAKYLEGWDDRDTRYWVLSPYDNNQYNMISCFWTKREATQWIAENR